MPKVIAGLYEIEKKIGAGGGGIVYLGRHIRLEKPVVLKADKRTLSTGTEALRREVDLLKKLSHTYIPQVYDFVQEDGVVYTVMDFIEGESLDKLLGRKQIPSQQQVIRWACQLLEALQYLHTRPPYGILHGDIKPANIMLQSDGDICLIDFNIALALGEEGAVKVGFSRGYASPEHYGADYIGESRPEADYRSTLQRSTEADGERTAVLNPESDPNLTEALSPESDDERTAVLNPESDLKPTEMLSPEAVEESAGGRQSGISESGGASPASSSTGRKRDGLLLDVRSDIYSLGATLYHLLSGVRPDQDARKVEPLKASVCSPAVAAILCRAMAPLPEERYQTAEEMLNAFLTLHRRDPRAVRRRRRMAVSAGALSALFLLGGAAAFTGQRQLGQIQEAFAMSEYSANALAQGDVSEAVRMALEAIPAEKSFFDAPATAQARLALTEALGVYDLEDGFKSLDTLELPGAPFDLTASPDGTRLAVVYAFEAAVYDLETLERIAVIPVRESALSGCAFIDEGCIVAAGREGIMSCSLDSGETLWTGRPCSTLSISADGRRVAAVDRREGRVTVYSTEDGGEVLSTNFTDKHMRTAANDIFANPKDDIFALNGDGTILAVSFDDGGLVLLDMDNPEYAMTIFEESEYSRFQGGFQGQYFAFAAEGDGNSVFGLIDVSGDSEPLFFDSDGEFLLQSGERGIYLAEGNLLAGIEPAPGTEEGLTQRELARTDKVKLTAFSVGEKYVLAATEDAGFSFYDRGANLSSRESGETIWDFAVMAGDYAVLGSRNEPSLRLLQLERRDEAQLLSYDAGYRHSEARISGDGRTAMLFDDEGFRIYDMEGNVLAEQELPDSADIYDQQFIKEADASRKQGGSLLEVIWYDGTRRCYSAADGSLLLAETGEVPEKDLLEEFLTDRYRFVSGLHAAPEVYERKSGRLAAVLEQDSYLTYVTQVGEYILTEYISTEDERYGILLDSSLQKIAVLPGLCDVAGDKLIFDCGSGDLRYSRIYSLEELTEMGEEFLRGGDE